MLPALPAMAALFLVRRVLFFRGYAHGAPSRAFGFAPTFYSTMETLIKLLRAISVTILSGSYEGANPLVQYFPIALIIGVELMVVTGNASETPLHSAGASY